VQHFLQSVLWPKDDQGQGGRERGAGQGLNFCSDRGWLPSTKFLFCAAPCCPVVLRRSPWVWFAKQNRVTRDSSNGIASQSHRAPRRRHPCSCRSDAGAHHRHRRRGVWARSLGPAPASTPALAPRAHRLTRPPPHAPTAARAHRRTRPTRRPRPPPPSSAGYDETTTDAHKRQGAAYLQAIVASEGHADFDAWATRVGGGCEWERPGGLQHEFARICRVWQSRGYISSPEKTIATNELRAVKAGWKIVFSTIVGKLMPNGWCDEIPIFKEMSREAERQARKRKIDAGRTLTRRAECELQLKDALQIAQECLARAEQSVGGQAMLKFLHAHQQIVWALQGKRGMLLVRQRTSDAIVKPFGAGEEFGPRLFCCELQPECLVLERELKGEAAQQTMELLGVIPCRKTILCPVAALAMLRLYQFGRSFQGGCRRTTSCRTATATGPSLNHFLATSQSSAAASAECAPMHSWRLPRRSAMTRQVARQCGIGLCLPLFRECRRSSGHRV